MRSPSHSNCSTGRGHLRPSPAARDQPARPAGAPPVVPGHEGIGETVLAQLGAAVPRLWQDHLVHALELGGRDAGERRDVEVGLDAERLDTTPA